MRGVNPDLLKTKPHFDILDGLRGLAALAIVIFHFMEWVLPDLSDNFIGHGFLAVDFFFCLSGFVIAYAYDDRLGTIGVVEFFKSRLIRLHPLVVLGAVLGLLAYLFDPFSEQSALDVLNDAGRTILLFICSIFLIPMPIMEERAFNLFGLNAPAWTLFWEYVANIFYAVILYKLGRRFLLLLIVLAAAALCMVSFQAGNLLGGWNGETFWHGGVRIAYSFLAGLFIYRSNWIIKNSLGFPGLAILLSLVFIMPHLAWNWLAEALVVLFYFPLLVALGAGASHTAGFRKICVFSGKLSYPLYMTHYAAIWIFGNYLTIHQPDTATLSAVIIGGTLFLVGFAYLTMVLYDIPLRRYLSARRKQKHSPH